MEEGKLVCEMRKVKLGVLGIGKKEGMDEVIC